MPKSPSEVAYLIFDVESIADGDLIARTRYPDMGYTPREAIATYQDELVETKGTTFIPHTYQIPISVVIAKVSATGELLDLVSLDEPEFRSHVMTANFWKGWEAYGYPTWVTFNGRSFDMPLMELAAFRYGIPLKHWFGGSGYSAPRNRFNQKSHCDLQEVLTNYGASRCNGGLNLMANLVAKPGKIGLKGDLVQEKYDEGELQAISDYCRCDVLDTYFVFLRTQTLSGAWTLDHELSMVEKAKQWVTSRADEASVYGDYLEYWGQWENPWTGDDSQ